MFTTGLEDFENGLSHWSASPGEWGLSSFLSFSGRFAANSNPPGSYGQNLNTWLALMLPLDLSELAAAKLSFMEQHFFASNQDDFGVVEISGDGGQSWTALSQPFRDVQGQWQERSYSLTPYAGAGFNDVRLRFRVQTDDKLLPPRRGWFIDDVRIFSNLEVAVQPAAETAAIPATFALSQNYPNPLRASAFSSGTRDLNSTPASTLIRFDLPVNAQVEIAIYDLLGRRLATLLDGHKPAGVHTVSWDARDEGGKSVARGIYFYRLKAVANGRREFQSVRKMVVQ
jgi:hypothetical protein